MFLSPNSFSFKKDTTIHCEPTTFVCSSTQGSRKRKVFLFTKILFLEPTFQGIFQKNALYTFQLHFRKNFVFVKICQLFWNIYFSKTFKFVSFFKIPILLTYQKIFHFPKRFLGNFSLFWERFSMYFPKVFSKKSHPPLTFKKIVHILKIPQIDFRKVLYFSNYFGSFTELRFWISDFSFGTFSKVKFRTTRTECMISKKHICQSKKAYHPKSFQKYFVCQILLFCQILFFRKTAF